MVIIHTVTGLAYAGGCGQDPPVVIMTFHASCHLLLRENGGQADSHPSTGRENAANAG